MIRRPPRSTLSSSSAASDVYKRQYQRRVRGRTLTEHTDCSSDTTQMEATPLLTKRQSSLNKPRKAMLKTLLAMGACPIQPFISSTFLDFVGTRTYLRRFIWPQLQEYCRRRTCTFNQIDLSWGISEEQAEQGQVLFLCLDYIRKSCRPDEGSPFAMILLGERYGTSVDEMPDSLEYAADHGYPWVKTHPKCSITELEILQIVASEENLLSHGYGSSMAAYGARTPAEGVPEAHAERATLYFATPGRVRAPAGSSLTQHSVVPPHEESISGDPTISLWVVLLRSVDDREFQRRLSCTCKAGRTGCKLVQPGDQKQACLLYTSPSPRDS
eukprot:TRINITY_DN5421_c0_g1_i3.p1 TRINITY_DN5421_c0_g1~~TRINITY_DN5421_c0_g1_i3.p1  ORF type:complete len:328 (-),score=64.20 TRINITY_DN5421_c0_g1_i3:102-1085(-)